LKAGRKQRNGYKNFNLHTLIKEPQWSIWKSNFRT
jgi:hypothetical protein